MGTVIVRDTSLSPTLLQVFPAALPNDTAKGPSHSFNEKNSLPLFPQDSLTKQFIPVAVLLAFLLLFFALHLLRYPRILYIPQHLRGSPFRGDRRRYSRGKMELPSSTSFLRAPLSTSRNARAPPSRGMIALYSRPTVRLVREYNTGSNETHTSPREEITLPHSSPTLVGSSSSELITSDTETHGIPPRVYLPPTLSEIYDYSFLRLEKPEDAHIIDVNTEPLHATPSSSPVAPAFIGLYDLLETSADILDVPFEDVHDSSTTLVTDLEGPKSQVSDTPVSPDLSPPPAALVHPILVRRALSPWRRVTPSEASSDAVPAQEATNNADPRQRHRPSVPSRLRHFITRSASISVSSSNTGTTPQSSLGKRSEKSSRATGKSNRESSLSDAESHVDSDQAQPQSFMTMFLGRAQAPLLANAGSLDLQQHDAGVKSEIPSRELQPENDQPSFFEPLSPPETSDGSVESPGTSSNGDEEEAAGKEVAKIQAGQVSGWFSASDIHRTSDGYQALLGLGLGLRQAEPASRTPLLEPASRFLRSVTSGMSRADDSHPIPDGTDEDNQDPSEAGNFAILSPSLSLRTVFARWMNWGYDNPQHIIEEEENRSLVMPGGDVADESVEVMVMNRWAGLEGL